MLVFKQPPGKVPRVSPDFLKAPTSAVHIRALWGAADRKPSGCHRRGRQDTVPAPRAHRAFAPVPSRCPRIYTDCARPRWAPAAPLPTPLPLPPPPPLSLPTPSRVASLVFLRGARPPRAPADVAAARHGPAAGSAALIWARAPGGRRGGSRPRSQPGRPLPNSSRAVSGERAGSEDVASQPPPDCWRARVGSLPRPYLLPPSGWLPKAQSKREMQTNWPLLDALGEFLSALGP